ncbi:MAG: OmpA family protein [Aliarcobacter sp.]|jgi:OOP family OmpA-OmpF porin|nr:OmpA family protein [Aliarcobacter sp.]
MKKILLTSILCAASLFSASSPSNLYGYELTPFVSGILTDSKAGLEKDNYANIGISLGKNFNDSFVDQVEIAYMRSESVQYKDSNADTNINRAFLNVIKKYALTEKLSAYGLLGAGYQDVTQELGDYEDSPLFNYGVGLRYDIPYYGIAVKTDVRHLIALKNNENDFMYTLGLAMPLGKKYSETIAPTIPVIEPIKEEVKIVEKDDDNDGVINKLDKCPDTSPGVKVNKDGCIETVDLKINFDYNSSNIKAEYQNNLEDFSSMLKQDKTLKAIIEAHTDSIASDKYNQALSERRATSAVNALNEKGIDSSRLKAIGYGESQPIATNDTEEGRAQNRRVIGFINK